MTKNKTYAVFGLGRYGTSVAKELSANGAEVIAVDRDLSLVNALADEVELCKCADITDPEVFEALGISNVDTAIIAMANNFEDTILTLTLCKEAGVNNVIVKCADETHKKILLRVGADRVIIPEKESGIRLARTLLNSGFYEMLELSGEISMIELDVKKEWVGKSLIDLSLRQKYSLNVVAIRKSDKVSIDINPSAPLEKDMKLIVVGNTKRTEKLR